MSQNDQQNKTEEPTQHKLEKAREEGNVPKSTEVVSVLLMIITVVILLNFGGWIYGRLEHMFESFFVISGQGIHDQDNAIQYLEMALSGGMEIMTPLLIGMFVVAILAHVVQTGVVFAPKILELKASRISPLKGFQKIFSMHGLVELAKGVGNILLIGCIIYFTLRNEIGTITSFPIMPLKEILAESGGYILTIITRILAALIVVSLLDAAYQQYKHKKDLRMTKQEVKDEHKQREGDPHMKEKRKEKAMDMRNKRLDHAVMSSEVVVTNPTHYAVALAYEPEKNDAPIIKAKGMRKRALKIREYANEFEIPIVENPPVARALHASADEDEFVPPELYQAVAEILAYVYRLKQENKI